MKAERSLYVANDASAGCPLASATRPEVNSESARVASARLEHADCEGVRGARERASGTVSRTAGCTSASRHVPRRSPARAAAPAAVPPATAAPTNGSAATTASGPELLQLAPDAERKQHVEERTVQPPRPHRRRKPEAVGRLRAAASRPHRGSGSRAAARRRPTSLRARCERQAVPPAADEEHARPSHRAASARSASSLP